MKLNVEKLNLAIGYSGMTLSEIAEQAGISKGLLSILRNNRGNPKPMTIGKMAKALNVKIEDIIED